MQEWSLLGLILLAGFGLRAVHAERMAVEHFDEGVYASNFYCQPPGLPEEIFPRQHLYAPPLWPWILEWVLVFSGGNAHAVMWSNVVLGTVMILAVWLVAKSWCGPSGGLTAATLCACSDVHLFFSRTALTDVLLCLFMTLGVWLGWRAIRSGRPVTIILAGLFAALAWWTKYNGWLTLAITGAGLCGWLIFSRPVGVSSKRLLARWLASAFVAGMLWSPVLWRLQSVGGYAAVAENHARYVLGWSAWGESLLRQLQALKHMQSLFGIAISITALGTFAAVRQIDRYETKGRSFTGLILLGIAWTALALGGGIAIPMAAAAVWGWRFRETKQTSAEKTANQDDQRDPFIPLAVWMVAAWVISLTLVTPLYTPYPRLMLPWIVGLWFAVTMRLGMMGRSPNLGERKPDSPPWGFVSKVAATLLIATGALLEIAGMRPRWPEVAWQDRTSLARSCPEIVRAARRSLAEKPVPGISVPQGEPLRAVFYTFADPALFYHLSAGRREGFSYLVQPSGTLDVVTSSLRDQRLGTFLVTGLYADSQVEQLASLEKHLELIEEIPFQASDLVLLDEGPVETIADRRRRFVRLYRVKEDVN